MVVNVRGKAVVRGDRYERRRRTKVNHRRRVVKPSGIKTGALMLSWDEAEGEPVYCSGGARHEDRASLAWALQQNRRTARRDADSSGLEREATGRPAIRGLFGIIPAQLSAWFFLGAWFLYQLGRGELRHVQRPRERWRSCLLRPRRRIPVRTHRHPTALPRPTRRRVRGPGRTRRCARLTWLIPPCTLRTPSPTANDFRLWAAADGLGSAAAVPRLSPAPTES